MTAEQVAHRKAYMRAYYLSQDATSRRTTPAALAAKRARESTPEYKEARKLYTKTEAFKSRKKERESREDMRAKRKAYMRRYASTEQWKQRQAAYRATDRGREIVALHVNRRRLRKLQAGGSHTVEQWVRLCQSYGNSCAYCGSHGKLTRDHDVPICRGGTDDISNLMPACGSCNSRKRHLTADEFMGAR